MKHEQRADERFEEFGKVEVEKLCALPGVLDDISVGGCRVHFPLPVTVNMEADYSLRIHISLGNRPRSLSITCQPLWQRLNGNETEVGFKILPSIDTPLLTEYLNNLQSRSQPDFDIGDLLVDSKASFVG
mgnify:FL=1